MITKNTTHIGQTRELYAKNAAKLIDKLGYNEYWDLFLDVGLALLSVQFEKGDKYYQYHKRSAGYWNWFYAEFKIFEKELVDYLTKVYLDNNECKMEFMMLAHDGETEQSFRENYLKHLKIF